MYSVNIFQEVLNDNQKKPKQLKTVKFRSEAAGNKNWLASE